MQRARICIVFVFVLLACAACTAPAPAAATPESSEVPGPTVTLPATATAAPTVVSSATPAATLAPTATETPLPTATPTLALPVSLGTPLPELVPITAENVDRLELVGDYRRLPEPGLRAVVSADGNIRFTVAAQGIDVWSGDGLTILRHLDIPVLRAAEERPLWQLLQPGADGGRLLVIRASGADVFSAEGERLFAHDSPDGLEWVNLAYALSADGRFVAVELCSVGCYRRNAPFTQDFFIYDVDSGQPVYQWNQGVGGELRGANPVFSPDGKYLMTFIGGQAFLWDTATWKKITSYTAKVNWYAFPRFAYFSPVGSRVAIISEDTVNVWETAERRMVGQWRDRDISPLTQILFSPDGSKLGTLTFGRMQVRDAATGSVLQELDFAAATIASARLDNDGAFQFLAPAETGSILAPPWDADLLTWGLSFDPSAQGTVLRIPGRDGKNTCTWQPSGQAVCEEANSIPGTDGSLYRLSLDEETASIQPAEGGDALASVPARQYGSVQQVLAFDTSGKFLFYNARVKAATPYGTIANLSHNNLEVIAQYPMPFEASAISPDGRYIALQARAFPKNQLLIFDLQARQMIYDRNFLYGLPGLAFSADSSTLMHLVDQPGRENIQRLTLMRMDDRNRPKNVPLQATYRDAPQVFQFTPDGDLLFSTATGELRWMHLPDGAIQATLIPFPDDVLAHQFAISPDGRLLAAFYAGELKVWGVQP